MTRGYVVYRPQADGPRLYCKGRDGEAWTDAFEEAEVFQALHEANGVRGRHGAEAETWEEAYVLDALEPAAA